MTVVNVDYNRLIYLNQRIKDNTASKVERDEYMEILYRNGNLKKEQYEKYKSGQNSNQEDLVNAALTIGGVLLVAYLLDKLLSR
jgi:hypothetical protein